MAALTVTACAEDAGDKGEINIYSSRHYDTDLALYDDFTAQTGIKVNRIEADADALIERIQTEGELSPADLLINATENQSKVSLKLSKKTFYLLYCLQVSMYLREWRITLLHFVPAGKLRRTDDLFGYLMQLITNNYQLITNVEDNGFEPLTPCVQGRCSSQLS